MSCLISSLIKFPFDCSRGTGYFFVFEKVACPLSGAHNRHGTLYFLSLDLPAPRQAGGRGMR